MDEPEFWRWVWLAAAVVFGLGEMTSPGSFFLAPFAAGAVVAAIASFLGAAVAIGWLVFVVVSLISFAALRPLARRLDSTSGNPAGVGAQRLVGEQGVVLDEVPAGPDEVGLIRVGREEWRAQSAHGDTIGIDTVVTVTEVKGTRVIVLPIGLTLPSQPPERSS
ncbi:MAG: NfeD family protein [Acidimicrobiales bacterium]|nr:NfeD family protein [Acidimicrobiales bacterium]